MAAPNSPKGKGDELNALQRKIFTRWVNQKLTLATGPRIELEDVVTGFADGVALVKLLETLSEKQFADGKYPQASKVRMQQIDNCNRALKFLQHVGVVMQLKPSAENLVDHDERNVLGLVWAIMQKFLKFGSDDETEQKLSAEDALLMWVKNQVHAVKVENFTKSFHNGLAFAELIHKFRPKLINPAALHAENGLENLAKVFDAAHKYFGLEKYLQPSDIAKLDSKSAFIYVSEYYYGIANQRKLDLAARRITKLIQYTVTNDKMRAEYKVQAQAEKSLLDKVNAMLNDRTIDNTMAGAKAKLAQFQTYRKTDKNVIVDNFFKIEALFNHLALRLADHKRPAFQPEFSVPGFRQMLSDLEALEKVRSVELVAEVNRQIRLVQLNQMHEGRFKKIGVWIAEKEAYLNHKEVINSSGEAEYQLNRLASYDDESLGIQERVVKDLFDLGAELLKEKYEHSATIQSREGEVKASFSRLGGASKNKKVVLTDDLARMKYKEKIHLLNMKHTAKTDQINAWIEEKRTYLNKKEESNSVNEATFQLSLLDAYESDRKDMLSFTLPGLKTLGQEITTAAYKSDLSSWVFENPASVTGREAAADHAINDELAKLSAAKRKVLDADLAREIEKERLRLLFANQAGEFVRWTKGLVEDFAVAHFGFNLKEVQQYAANLKQTIDASRSDAAHKTGEFKASFGAGEKLGVKDNKYTSLTLDDLATAGASLEEAIGKMQGAYDAELARQIANDKLCQEFAAIANPLAKKLDEIKDSITVSKAALEAQVQTVKDHLAANEGGNEIKELTNLQAKLDAAGVSDNPHSHFNATEISTRVDQHHQFLNGKLKQLEEEVALVALRGLTKDQLAEIAAQFKQFDTNGNGRLDKTEFKACLFSLNEERTKADIQKIMTQHGDGGGITYDGFKDFMIKLLGDTDTQDEVVTGFGLLAHGNETIIKESDMSDLFAEFEINYMKTTMKANGGGHEYKPWVVDVFSR